MFLYTTQPYDMVFPPQEVGYEKMVFKTRQVFVSEVNGRRVISQLLSTNPKDFLNPDFFPGNEIN